MVIYGVAILAICLLVGTLIGELLGIAIDVDGNVGGVGIAMLMLILLIDGLKKRGRLSETTQSGLAFWSAIYIPIVVAMAATQDVASAVSGGPLAIIAGAVAVLAAFLLVPVLSKVGKQDTKALDNEQGGSSS